MYYAGTQKQNSIKRHLKMKNHNAAVYLFIQKKLSEGKSGKTAKIAGLNKFLKICYAHINALYRLIPE